jgi:hypothetical protein
MGVAPLKPALALIGRGGAEHVGRVALEAFRLHEQRAPHQTVTEFVDQPTVTGIGNLSPTPDQGLMTHVNELFEADGLIAVRLQEGNAISAEAVDDAANRGFVRPGGGDEPSEGARTPDGLAVGVDVSQRAEHVLHHAPRLSQWQKPSLGLGFHNVGMVREQASEPSLVIIVFQAKPPGRAGSIIRSLTPVASRDIRSR